MTVTDPAVAAYALGTTAATHSASDAERNATSCTNAITVIDSTDPTLSCPANVVVECNAYHAANGVSAGIARATDVCTAVTVTDPAVRQYPLGVTTATHAAIDQARNDTTCTNTVTVMDRIAPALSCPADVVVECNSQGGANGVNPGAATATDVCTDVTLSNPGVGRYLLGTTNVSHGAVDEAGNGVSCTNRVVVRDTTAPVFDAASLGPRTVSGACSSTPVAFVLPTATDGCQAVTVACGTVASDSAGANTVTCTATDVTGNRATTTITVNVLVPYRLGFTSLGDDNVRDDPETDADKINVFKSGGLVPHVVKVYSCNGTDVTSTIGTTMTLHLTVRYRSTLAGVGDEVIVPEYTGVGDAGGLMVNTGGSFKYTLNTNTTDYPAGTINTAAYFNTLVQATYNSAPGVVVAQEDARLESNTKGK